MKHLVFGLFEDAADAQRAIQALKDSDVNDYSVVMHGERSRYDDRSLSESNARRDTLWGALFGGIGGTVLGGLLAGPVGLIGGGPFFAALMTGFGGSFMGALHGALTGSAYPEAKLEQLAEEVEAGNVLVTVEVESLDDEDTIIDIFKKHAVSQTHREFL